jgi:MYXO-CTERM domain-containing protein
MSSPLSRHVVTLAAATFVLGAGFARTALAKTCTTDSDCGADYRCSLVPTGGGSSGGGGSTGGSTSVASDPMPGMPTAPADGGATTKTSAADAGISISVPSTGTCEPKPIVCTSTADCPADFECQKDRIAATNPSCKGDAACTTSPPPQVSETGTCQAVPRACSSSADCPAPLVCKSEGSRCTSGASIGSDGVVTTMPETCTEEKSLCTYVPTTCTTDSECAASYQCMKVSEGSSCSGSSGACTRSADGSVTCSTPEPPVCTSFVVMNCMPKQIPCAAGQACPSGWSCFDYSNFSGTVPGWTPDASGKACLPDGLVLAVQGHAASTVYNDSSGIAGGDKGSVSTAQRADGGFAGAVDVGVSGGGPTVPPSENSPSAIPDAGAGAEVPAVAANKDDGCGCSLGGAASSSANPWLLLALAGLVVRVVRRRR